MLLLPPLSISLRSLVVSSDRRISNIFVDCSCYWTVVIWNGSSYLSVRSLHSGVSIRAKQLYSNSNVERTPHRAVPELLRSDPTAHCVSALFVSRDFDDPASIDDDYRFTKAKDSYLPSRGASPREPPFAGDARPACARELDLCAHNHDYPV